eukprot:CAMPEP_0119369308 /NCGR_PEP_ID=MMETSP1334-20130426/15849_1 /TAXON_ID=127549 /ORGANISM="Calcidiscus leptoporus, Strain RCC1130" /LENGTH=78 /DNA_ID=CAMNT_0007386139 /DNA_START=189 /DNA_END=425 /DNA_ORIENTATION=+
MAYQVESNSSGAVRANASDKTHDGVSLATLGRFFDTTPEDLVASGLYSDIAIAFHEESCAYIHVAHSYTLHMNSKPKA